MSRSLVQQSSSATISIAYFAIPEVTTVVMNKQSNAEIECDLLICEYNALRAEMLDNFQTARTLLTVYLTAVGTIFFAVISGSVDAHSIILIPAISTIFWWIHLDTRMIVSMLGAYLNKLSARARELSSDRIFRWEEEIRFNQRASRQIHLALLPWKILGSIDGAAYMIYMPPSAIALWITYGKIGSVTLYQDAATRSKVFFTFPASAWWISAAALLVVFGRAIVTENAWWRALTAEAGERGDGSG
jgi:hypothetical protein